MDEEIRGHQVGHCDDYEFGKLPPDMAPGRALAHIRSISRVKRMLAWASHISSRCGRLRSTLRSVWNGGQPRDSPRSDRQN